MVYAFACVRGSTTALPYTTLLLMFGFATLNSHLLCTTRGSGSDMCEFVCMCAYPYAFVYMSASLPLRPNYDESRFAYIISLAHRLLTSKNLTSLK